MVRAAERRVRNAAAYADDGDGQILVAQIDAYLLERPVRGERGDAVRERRAAAQSQPGAESDHALLGHADVDDAVRKFLAEGGHAAGGRNVGDDDEDVRP